jgi:hypothetical protein
MIRLSKPLTLELGWPGFLPFFLTFTSYFSPDICVIPIANIVSYKAFQL